MHRTTAARPRHVPGTSAHRGDGRRPRTPLLVLAVLAGLLLAACKPLPPVDEGPLPPSAYQPGEVITAEPTTFTLDPVFNTPTPLVDAQRIYYRTTSASGEAIGVSGTVLVPEVAWPGPGSRPLVSYAVGTRGVGDACAPSSTLANGTDYEGLFITALLLRGWAVAVTDYEGLGTDGVHTYMVGRSQGHAVLDMARAAKAVAGGGVGAASPVGIWGYSQGGASAGWAAELADTYAPDLDVVGVVAGGVPADLGAVAEFVDGTPFVAFALLAALGYDAAYPELSLESYLNADGRQLQADSSDVCLVSFDGIATFLGTAFRTLDSYTTVNPLGTPAWQARLAENRLGADAPDMPVYQFHAVLDEIVPFAQAEDLRDAWCARGVQLTWKQHLLAEHVLGMVEGAPGAVGFLADRFAGRPAATTC